MSLKPPLGEPGTLPAIRRWRLGVVLVKEEADGVKNDKRTDVAPLHHFVEIVGVVLEVKRMNRAFVAMDDVGGGIACCMVGRYLAA